MAFELQDPEEAVTYSFNWADWVDSSVSPADTVSTSSWAVTPSSGVTITDRGANGNVTSARVEGLTRDTLYRVTNTVTSTNGDTGERSIVIWCEQR